MATKQPDSVVARLMRLEEHPPDRQTSRKQGRVLSDSYIRKTASVGLRHGSLFSARCLHGVNSVPGVQISNDKHDFFLNQCLNSTTNKVKLVDDSVSKSLCGVHYEDRRASAKKDKHLAPGHVLRYLQKIECGSHAGQFDELGVDYKSKFLNNQSELIDKQCFFPNSMSVCEPKPVKLANDDDLKSDLNPESGKCHLGLAYKKLVVSDVMAPRYSSIAHKLILNRISQPERRRCNYNDVCRSGYMSGNYTVDEAWALMPSFPGIHDYKIYNYSRFSNDSSLATEAKKHDIERRKMSKAFQGTSFFGRGETLHGMFVMASGKSVPRNVNLKLGGNDCNLSQDESTWRNKSKKQNVSQKNILESLYWRDYEQCQFTHDVNATVQSSEVSESSSRCFVLETNKAEPEAGTEGIREEMDDRCVTVEPVPTVSKLSINDPLFQSAIHNALASAEAPEIGFHYSESNLFSLSTEDGHSSYEQGFFDGEATLNGLSEEESPYPNRSRIGPSEFQDYSKGTNHCSPDSVLEPVGSPNPSPPECFKNLDLLLQPQDLHFESEETYSEGSVMVVSGGNDSEEGFGHISADKKKVQKWLGYHESRNFSYLVDVLNEAGFCTMKSFMDIRLWDSPEYSISSHLFEMLEKKYGKQTSWEKSERHLLFDRINSGLMDILNPVVNFHNCSKSMSKQFISAWRRDEVEDDLWMMLMREEEEKNRSLNEKVLGRGMKWLELDEDISFICRELETSLFDEVVMELVSLLD